MDSELSVIQASCVSAGANNLKKGHPFNITVVFLTTNKRSWYKVYEQSSKNKTENVITAVA